MEIEIQGKTYTKHTCDCGAATYEGCSECLELKEISK